MHFKKMLNSAIPDVDVTVFGRIKDFQKNIKKQPPDAVLSYRPVIDNETGVSIGLQGTKRQPRRRRIRADFSG